MFGSENKPMTYDDALKIFGLSYDFTEAEYKKAYRREVKKYHSDNFNELDPEREKRIREISQAKKIIDERLKQRTSNIDDDTEDYNKNDDKDKKTYDDADDEDDFVANYIIEAIDEIVNSVGEGAIKELKDILENYITALYHASTIMNINDLKEEFYQAKKNFYKDQEQIYRELYKIPDTFIHSVNYDCTWDDFKSELANIIESYKKAFEKALDEKVEEAKNFAGYEHVETQIAKEKEIFQNDALKDFSNGFNTFESTVESLRKRILEIFAYYFKNYDRFKDISKRVNAVNDKAIADLLIELYNNLYEEEFDYIYDDIVYFLNKKDENVLFDNIHKHLIDSSSKVLHNLKIADDSNQIKNIYNLLSELIVILKLADLGVITLDDANLIYNITFENLEKDQETLDSLVERINLIKSGSIYMNTDDDQYGPFYFLEYDNGLLNLIQFDLSIPAEDIKGVEVQELEDYISLENFFYRARYIGKIGTYKRWKHPFCVVYKLDDKYLLYDASTKKFTWTSVDSIEFSEKTKTLDENIFLNRCLKERDYIKNFIIKNVIETKKYVEENPGENKSNTNYKKRTY